MATVKNNGFWQRMHFKFRLSVLNENTLNEVWHIRLSRFGMFVFALLLFAVTFALFALIIFISPLRNYLPGYNEDVRQDLMSEVVRVDSISDQLALQTTYLSMIRDVMSGEVESDSITTLDSLAVIQREQLLLERTEVTDEFIRQYEDKERDYLMLFDVQTTAPMITLFKPVKGVISEHYGAEGKQSISLLTTGKENVVSVLPGTVVFSSLEFDHAAGWVVVVQHSNDLISVYRNIGKPVRKVGDKLKIGENIALAPKDKPLVFELWQNGSPLNPETLIAF